MRSDKEIEMLKEFAKQNEEYQKELMKHPLSEYSTTQLKAEIRRRKGER